MLIAVKVVRGSAVVGTDGKVGTVRDLLFDQRSWAVRYLEVHTGGWLTGRRVLLSPSIVTPRNWPNRELHVPLGRQQIEQSPPVEHDLPVSRQKEIELAQYFAWGEYWATVAEGPVEVGGDPNLRSAHELKNYRIHASDGHIGHVDDLIVDDHAWQMRYLIVDTRDWLPGKHVLIVPAWVESFDWAAKEVRVDVSRALVEGSPEFEPAAFVNREYEEVFYDYYGRPRYWRGVSE